MTDVVSIDWCEDEEQVCLPWDADQWIRFKRLSARDRRRRRAIGGKITIDGQGRSPKGDMVMDAALDKVKVFEWTHCIVAFRLIDNKGEAHEVTSDQEERMRILNYASPQLEEFIDAQIARINKEDAAGAESSEVEEVAGNSESS